MTQSAAWPPNRTPPQVAGAGGSVAGKVVLPGGALYQISQHPAVETFERQYRVLAEDSMFSPELSPQRPFTFEIGSYRVPNSMALALYDYEFTAGAFSGVSAGNTVPLEEGSFSTVWGFDITINESRPVNATYELDPVPIVGGKRAYQEPTVTTTRSPVQQFDIDASNSFAAAGASARATLPFRTNRSGPRQGPWTQVAPQGSSVSVKCIIFQPLPQPIPYVQACIRGYLMPVTVLDIFMKNIQP